MFIVYEYSEQYSTWEYFTTIHGVCDGGLWKCLYDLCEKELADTDIEFDNLICQLVFYGHYIGHFVQVYYVGEDLKDDIK